MIVLLSLLVLTVGLVVYFAATNKAVEIGRIMFAVGLFIFLLNTDKFVTLFSSR